MQISQYSSRARALSSPPHPATVKVTRKTRPYRISDRVLSGDPSKLVGLLVGLANIDSDTF